MHGHAPTQISRTIIGFIALASLAAAGSDLRLVDAAKRNDRAAVQALLRQHVNVDARHPDGTTALAWAAYHDDLAMAESLMRAGADVKVANDYGESPLSLACRNMNAVLVGRLLKAGADPNATRATGETALMTAARVGSLDAVRQLIEAGARVDATEPLKHQTALMWALGQKHLSVASALMAAGADVNAPSKGGSTPLHFAVRQGDVAATRILLDAGADPNATTTVRQMDDDVQPFVETLTGVTPLWLAISGRSEELGALLLEYGADPNTGQYKRIPPLHFAVSGGMPRLVAALLAYGAVIDARVPDTARPPDEALIGHKTFFVQPVGATPFFLAAQNRDVDLMRLLVNAGANPRIATEDGTTPLMAAAGVASDARLRRDPMEMMMNFRPNNVVVRRPQAKEAVALALSLDENVNVNAANLSGHTALHGAAYVGSPDLVQFLVDKGAALDSRDRDGLAPLAIAEREDARLLERLASAVGEPDPAIVAERAQAKATVELLRALRASR